MHPVRLLRLPLLAALLLACASFAVAGCGYESEHKDVVEGEPVKLGDLTYNVIFSRFLNPDDSEDAGYLAGLPAAQPGSAYFGVFVEVKNSTNEAHRVADEFTITDVDGNEFDVLESESPYAFPFGAEVPDQEQIPILDSTAATGPIEGSAAVFLLPAEASEARPLILEIPGEDGPARVTLDL